MIRKSLFALAALVLVAGAGIEARAGEIYLQASAGKYLATGGCSSTVENSANHPRVLSTCADADQEVYFNAFYPGDVTGGAGSFTPTLFYRQAQGGASDNTCWDVSITVLKDDLEYDTAAFQATSVSTDDTSTGSQASTDVREFALAAEVVKEADGSTTCASGCINQPIVVRVTRLNTGCTNSNTNAADIIGLRLSYP